MVLWLYQINLWAILLVLLLSIRLMCLNFLFCHLIWDFPFWIVLGVEYFCVFNFEMIPYVVIHSFDVFELLILSYDCEHSILNFFRSSRFCYFTFYEYKQSGVYFVKIICSLRQFILTIVKMESIVGMTRC